MRDSSFCRRRVMSALLSVLFTWSLLASFALLGPLLGTSQTVVVSFLAVTAWLLATSSVKSK